MDKSTFTYVTYIRTSPKDLWHALTTNALAKQYWFGMSVESDWKAGSPWKIDSSEGVMDSGKILECVSHKRLVIQWLNEWKPEFQAEGPSRCVYEIEPIGPSVKLTVTHSMEKPDSKFIEAVSEGWPMILANLKSLLETGTVTLVDHPG